MYKNGEILYSMGRNKGIAVFPILNDGSKEFLYLDLTYDGEWSIDGEKEGAIKYQSISILQQEVDCKSKLLEFISTTPVLGKNKASKK